MAKPKTKTIRCAECNNRYCIEDTVLKGRQHLCKTCAGEKDRRLFRE